MKKLNRFDGIARYYDWLTAVIYGSALREAQTKYLTYIPAGAHVLVLGGGTGWWLKSLLTKNTTCTIWYVEASIKMIQHAMKNSTDSTRVKFIHGTHKDIPDNIQFNAVITFFFLDLFDDSTLYAVLSRIKYVMHSEGIWLVSDFVNKKKWHSLVLSIMYFLFRTIGAMDTKALPNWETLMKNSNTQLVFCTSYFGKFIQSNVYKM